MYDTLLKARLLYYATVPQTHELRARYHHHAHARPPEASPQQCHVDTAGRVVRAIQQTMRQHPAFLDIGLAATRGC